MTTRVDPLTKLFVALTYVVLVTLCNRTGVLVILAAVLVLWLIASEGVKFGRLVRALLPFVAFALSSAWIYAVAPDPSYRAVAGSGWAVALLVVLRTVTTGLVSIAFVLTSEPADVARALIQRVGLPRRFVYGALAAVQFIPALAEEVRIARMTARADVQVTQRRAVTRPFRLLLASLNPGLGLVLLSGAVRRASMAAIAMELRGLGAAHGPLIWHVPPFTRRDLGFAATALALLATAWLAVP
jgi:energy-coupling factor transport system permease protein